WNAGALIADTEFVQFHPTAMDVGLDPAPLATEALRGEGAVLRDGKGELFMARYHEKAELAPRDEVARAIDSEIKAGRGAFLDATVAVGDDFPAHFPTVFAACMAAGIDPREAPIPVAPAAHYHMGGVVSSTWGRSSLEGLSVCGECASTGAHGANRLASNSLLEAVVFAARIAERLTSSELGNPEHSRAEVPNELAPDDLLSLRRAMASKCGVVRNGKDLQDLVYMIDEQIEAHGPVHALQASRLIASAALAREDRRGGHFRRDFPDAGPVASRSFLETPSRTTAKEAV
ncbi:MAG: FAD-binding protein, partial [Henriciella sp.]|nr:FAD-binding protein [Henriciella sp.]